LAENSKGNFAQGFSYAPFGAVLSNLSNGSTTIQRQYIGQYTDNSGLSYLNARYYNGTQGQFTSEDPVFLSTQQNLGDPQSLNAYSYSENDPITKSDPSGKCLEDACVGEALVATSPEWGPYVVPALGAAFNIAGTYLSNHLAHQQTTPFEVATAGATGAAFPYAFSNTLSGLFASGFVTSALEDLSAKRKFDAGNDAVSGLTSSLTYGVFKWGAGVAPLEEGAESTLNNLRYQTVLNTFQTSSGVVAQNSYSNSSFGGGVQQAQNYISSAVQSGAAKIGNAIGGFVGTFNFGSGVGTYNAGTGQWAK
jgi:RHS repeat-associated protein